MKEQKIDWMPPICIGYYGLYKFEVFEIGKTSKLSWRVFYRADTGDTLIYQELRKAPNNLEEAMYACEDWLSEQ